MPPGTPSTSAAAAPAAPPDWLAAAAKMETPAAEPDRIALRTSAPPAAARPTATPTAPKPRPEIAEAVAAQPVAKPKPADVKPAKKDRPPPEFIDVAYYPSRLMIPETVVLTAMAVSWVLFAMPSLPAQFQTWEILASVPGAIALFQGVRWLFRVTGGGYRLTAKQILRSLPGPIPDPEPVDLASISTVAVERTPLEWVMFAGRIKLSFERDTQPALMLGPVSWSGRRAEMLRKAIDSARSGNVVSARVAA